MTAYAVTAANSHFWMTLVVEAGDREEAAQKFKAYLDSAEHKAAEEYEYEQALQIADEPDADGVERGDYRYRFEDRDIADEDSDEFFMAVQRWTGEVTDRVAQVRSGGNG